MLSQSMEDYLKVIFEVLEREERAATSVIAEQMGIAAPSVTAMLKKLAALKLIDYEPENVALMSRIAAAYVDAKQPQRAIPIYEKIYSLVLPGDGSPGLEYTQARAFDFWKYSTALKDKKIRQFDQAAVVAEKWR